MTKIIVEVPDIIAQLNSKEVVSNIIVQINDQSIC